MTDLNMLANLAEILGGTAVLGGVLFAVYQISHLRRQRRDASTFELMHAFQDKHFVESVHLLLNVDEETYEVEKWTLGSARHRSFITVGFVCESLGVMVFHRTISLKVLDQVMGGVIRAVWQRVRLHVEAERERQRNPHYHEWFQWLSDRLEKDPSPEKGLRVGAYELYSKWKG